MDANTSLSLWWSPSLALQACFNEILFFFRDSISILFPVALTGRLHLNRQVIVLMSGLGVSNDAFFRLQEAMIQRLAQMLINEEQAAFALSQVNTVNKHFSVDESYCMQYNSSV